MFVEFLCAFFQSFFDTKTVVVLFSLWRCCKCFKWNYNCSKFSGILGEYQKLVENCWEHGFCACYGFYGFWWYCWKICSSHLQIVSHCFVLAGLSRQKKKSFLIHKFGKSSSYTNPFLCMVKPWKRMSNRHIRIWN